MRITHTLQGCSALLAGLLFVPMGVHAAPGDLDPHFDVDGRVTTDFGGDDYANAVARQPDGRIVAAGHVIHDGTTDFALTRYRRTGQLDTTFGGDGRVVTHLGRVAIAHAVVVQPNGRIVAGGYVNATSEEEPDARPRGFALTRYKPNGQLDVTFGGDGIVITEGRNLDIIYGLALQQDGKIIAAGWATDRSTNNSDFALVRYLPNGRLDSSFGSHGVVTTDFGGPDDHIRAITLQPDGRIVAAGVGGPILGQREFAVARYLPDGTPDVSFSGDGRVTTFVGNGYFGTALALQSDGKIVVGGEAIGINSHFALVRYLADGTLDPTFDSDGQLIADLGGSDHVLGVAVQPNGRIVAAGWSLSFSTFVREFAVARFLANGAFDTLFGGVGWVTTAVGTGDTAQANAVVLQPNGKILTAGMARADTGSSDLALVRYLGDPGVGDTDSDVVPDEGG
jgi:uncharacterized delta-60 repeat protein